ncbi:MAG: HAD-IIIA family hydrolase [Candidatus Cloacimonadales bacterium]|nr:HAD-IIIA family hydrolase [Candidatus Cloacimonadota bacterium]MDY0380634.1 HAD-IIIA family hydrolase [Candidatus Cloacimonadaceae bacterium]HCM16369.1 HAD family hydrolase [Candidatus Cloacimonas sp.]MCB5256855.1 HAD-IIIA family hydrolase [Candidatus Cloacimonadota bacterium]MCB5263405.1 HAD-IIIA family hydrolase [Candidatus Cloacimonadota bacterium]
MIARDIRRAVFLDRDGTISPDKFGYIKDPAGYHLYPESPKALKMLQDMGFLIFIVTNQSGIARGYLNLTQLAAVHQKMLDLLADGGVRPDGLYFSPYHKEGIVEPFNVHHEDRKPGIGMFRRARREHPFITEHSFMIGDRFTDIGFARNAGMKSILLLSGNGQEEFDKMLSDCAGPRPDFICENILCAAEMIQRYYP